MFYGYRNHNSLAFRLDNNLKNNTFFNRVCFSFAVFIFCFDSSRLSVLKRISGTASATKAMTNYLDSLLGDPQKRLMKAYFPMHMSFLGEYPDVASFLFVMSIARND